MLRVTIEQAGIFVSDELIVRLNPGESPDEFFAGLDTYHRQRGTNDTFVATVPGVSGPDMLLLVNELHGDPRIVWAEANFSGEVDLYDPSCTPEEDTLPEGSGGLIIVTPLHD